MKKRIADFLLMNNSFYLTRASSLFVSLTNLSFDISTFTHTTKNRIMQNRLKTIGLSLTMLGLAIGAQAQSSISAVNAVYTSVNDNSDNYSEGGNNYNFNVGSENNLLILSVEANGKVFNPGKFADRIEMQRVTIAGIPDEREIFFYEGQVSGNNINLKPSFLNTMEEVLLNPILNRGVDNIFQNTGDGSGNVNNVMRLDFIFEDGLQIPADATEEGFIVKERGGNDPIKIAAITSLDAFGNAASFGTVVSATPSDWGPSGYSLRTQVLRKPNQTTNAVMTANLNPQPLTGILFTFQDMGVSPGDVIYGYALAAGDAPSNSSDWLDVSTFPINTTASSGGLDLVAGGAYFSSNPVIEAEDDHFTTPFETMLQASVATNDTYQNGSVFELIDNPLNGSVVFHSDGTFEYTPNPGFDGVDEFTYKVCLPEPLSYICDDATVFITVEPPLTGEIINYYPATGPGTLAFEDLWPAKGDYDFNDLVIDYQFELTSNLSNYVDQIVATFTIQAFGASFENGFGFQLNENIDASDLSVTGFDLTENFITLNANGTEAGQSKPTIIVFDNAFAQMPHPGIGIGVNTEPFAPYVTPVTLTITIDFEPDTYSYNDVAISDFNPFIIVDQNRAVEVHLPNYPPTDLADQSMFGQWDDASDASTGKYYVTPNNLPWAINIYEKFDWPIEKQDITWVHLKFAEWAVSGGTMFPDWYKDLPGYRNNGLIYQVP